MNSTVRVRGLRELQSAFRKADKALAKDLRDELKEVGRIVQEEATRRFTPIDPRSAAGYKVRVRGKGVAVEQSKGRTTGLHPQFGVLQMQTALIPALDAKEGEVVRRLEDMLDRIAGDFN
jgi:hypothetical protein